MDQYDTDNDGQLDAAETVRLADDIDNWDIGAESISIEDIRVWISQYDTNGDKRLSVNELGNALNFWLYFEVIITLILR